MAAAQILRMPIPGDRPDWENKLDLVRRTVAMGATDDEFETFLYHARRTGLDPLAKQIHFVKRGNRGSVQTAIDGLRLIADRTGLYAGNDDAEFEVGESKHPLSAKATVYKLVGGVRCPFSATARWDEYYPGDAAGSMWRKMPHVMIAKCAEALALRKAFPADMSGLYVNEEMAQADESATVSASAPSVAPTVVATVTEVRPEPQPVLEGEELAKATMREFGISTAETPKVSAPSTLDAFGYKPIRWPTKKMFGESATDSQRAMMKLKADERSIDEELRPRLRAAILEAYGVANEDTKAAASLYIDWLIHADESTVDAGCSFAEKELVPA